MARTLMGWGVVFVGLLMAGSVVAPSVHGGMTLLSARTWGNSSGAAVAVGPDGTVYVAGFTVVGEYPLQDSDATLVRWGSDGELLWARSWRGFADEEARGVAVDATGAAYITGVTTSFGIEAFVVKFDAAGNLEWQRTWGGSREDAGEAIAVGPDGGIYVAGFTQSFGISFPGAVAFLLKLSPNGSIVWERTWETPDGGFLRDLAVSADGGIYVGGLAYPRGFVAKFNSDGTLLWDRTYLATWIAFTDFEGLAATPDGGVVAVGSWQPTFDQEVLYVRFASDGSLLHARGWGGESAEVASDAVVGPDGTAYVVGGTDTFSSGVYDDFFILKVLATGRATEARVWGGPFQDVANAAVLGPNGDLYVVGGVSSEPTAFGTAPAQMYRFRGGVLTDPAAIVGVPSGTVGIPTGEPGVLDVTAPSPGGATLLHLAVS